MLSRLLDVRGSCLHSIVTRFCNRRVAVGGLPCCSDLDQILMRILATYNYSCIMQVVLLYCAFFCSASMSNYLFIYLLAFLFY